LSFERRLDGAVGAVNVLSRSVNDRQPGDPEFSGPKEGAWPASTAFDRTRSRTTTSRTYSPHSSDRDVSDELFARVRRFYDDDAVVELTEIIAWENASSKFNRALRIPSQVLWKRK
jgi:alkylhydroperoxidase family enzyme